MEYCFSDYVTKNGKYRHLGMDVYCVDFIKINHGLILCLDHSNMGSIIEMCHERIPPL